MSRYFTSDWHLGSSLINKYANRPFSTQIDTCIGLIENCNCTAKRGDVVFHVGDFFLEGYDRHGEAEDKNELPADAYDYVKQISARFVLLSGNHDDGHNVSADLKSMVVDLNQNYRNVTVGHYPSTSHVIKKSWSGRTTFTKHSVNGYQGVCGRPDKIHIHLCGHVHDKWKYSYDNKNYILNYNVGVDCHDYKPVRDAEITEDLDFLFSHHDFNNSWKMTCKDEIEWKKTIKNKLERDREIRKKIRYQKKGLTEAECLRRKEEALRKKGLLKSK